MKRAVLALIVLTSAGCSTRAPNRPAPVPPAGPTGDRGIRVAIPTAAAGPLVSATTEFGWYDADGRTLVTRGRRGEGWRIEREARGSRVRAVRPDGAPTDWRRGLVARPFDEGFATINGKRYRGELAVVPVDTGFEIVNRLGLEDYLRGVVPVEMGNRPAEDSSALRAQAVASRTFALARMGDRRKPFDVRASTQDQVYGGVDVENARANAAVDATRGLVLLYEGRLADAPFHANCGGHTADVAEVWRSTAAPYLRGVSDRIGSSDRYYCDIAPGFRWTRTLSGAELNAGLEQYLAAYAAVPGGRPGRARALEVEGDRSESGRVLRLAVRTDVGAFTVRGNDIRYVMRPPGGEILRSTYFSVESEVGRDSSIARVTFRGQGNGHGVGMCQWGAMGRSRAGQSFRSILGTYYPGTTVGPVQ